MNDFQLGGRDFKLNKIDAFKQFHILRRITPILGELAPALKDVKKLSESASEREKLDMLGQLAAPIMDGLSKLTDADSELVLFGLLASVEMKGLQGAWGKVATTNMLLVQDLELPQLLHIAGKAFVYNLSGFFPALLQK